MKKLGYDMHVATEAGGGPTLKEALASLGFADDSLAERGLIFDEETARYYTACPLIDIHVSKKVRNHPELRELEIEVDRLLRETGAVGYYHSECVLADNRIEPETAFKLHLLPFERLRSEPRETHKVWDIHLAFRESEMPRGLGEMLIENGVYYLARIKNVPGGRKERFAVYTVQGVSRLTEGKEFYAQLCAWIRSIGAPACDVKLELTTSMLVYGAAKVVPPTIDQIFWR